MQKRILRKGMSIGSKLLIILSFSIIGIVTSVLGKNYIDNYEYQINYHNVDEVLRESLPLTIKRNEVIELQEPSKPGYVFLGWYMNNERITVVKGLDLKVTDFFKKHNIEARWDLVNYEITYTNTDDLANSNPITYHIETETIELSALEKDGYKFLGWFRNDVLVKEIKEGNTGDLILEAKWELIVYDIVYSGVHESSNDNPYTYNILSETTILNPIERLGYRFLGWYIKDDRVTQIDKGTFGDLQIEAKWEPITYQIIYEGIDDEANVNPTEYTIEQTFVLSPVNKEHYTFLGFYLDNVRITRIDIGWIGEMIIEARYSAKEYAISYTNLKDAEINNPLSYNVESETIVLNEPSTSGYYFLGWYLLNQKITSIEEGSTGNRSLEARWTPVEYTITYTQTKGVIHENPSTYNIETSTIVLSNLELEGYEFNGWYLGEDKFTQIESGNTGQLVLTAKWTPTQYTLSYLNTKSSTNNNPTNYHIETPTFELSNLSAVGYLFDGWYLNNEAITQINIGSVGNRSLEARWTPINYSITYTQTKGVIHENPSTYNIETSTTVLSDLELEGYEFNGWYLGEDKFTQIESGNTGHLVLTAKWTPTQYTLSYLNTKSSTNNNPTNYHIETLTFELSNLSAVGYLFDGWYLNNEAITQINIGSVGNRSLEARWTPINYSISYTNLKQSEQINPISYTIEDTITFLLPETNGYTFEGFYLNGNKVSKINPGTYGDLTIDTSWILVNYQISYLNLKGATHSNPSTYTFEIDPVILLPIEVPYYLFEGYENQYGEIMTEIPTYYYGDLTLTAILTPIEFSINYYNLEGATHSNPKTYHIESNFTLGSGSKNQWGFYGWKTSNGEPITKIIPGGTGPIDIYATWGLIGVGTKISPYLIYDSTQFNMIRNKLDSHYRLMQDFTIRGSYVPIGSKTEAFTGSLDGNNKRITFSSIVDNRYEFGLFSHLGVGSEIKYLLINGILGTEHSRFRVAYYGGIAVRNYGKIYSVSSDVRGYFTHSSDASNGITVGGISSENFGEIQYATNTGHFDVFTTLSRAIAAGIVGYSNAGKIHEPNNQGNINVSAMTSAYAAGLIAYRTNSTHLSSTNRFGATSSGQINALDATTTFKHAVLAHEDIPKDTPVGSSGNRVQGYYYYLTLKIVTSGIFGDKVEYKTGWHLWDGNKFVI